MPRRVRGNFRSLIKRLPDAVADEFRQQLDATGKMLLSRALQRVPVDTGALRGGLTYKVLPKSLKLKVGLVGKPINKRLYYGRIVEFGRKAKTVIVVRKANRAAAKAAAPFLGGSKRYYKYVAHKHGLAGTYKLRVKALPPRHFVYATPREQIYRPFQKLWGKAIHEAAAGASDT